MAALFLVILLMGLCTAAISTVTENSQSASSSAPAQANTFPAIAATQQSQESAHNLPTPTLQVDAVKQYHQYPGDLSVRELTNKKAVIETARGEIEFKIYPEATKAASNFIFLANDSFYDGLTFHRVEKGLLIQGGDPTGTGTGGPGYTFPDDPVTRSYTKGTVAMANAGPNTNGSQFFILLEDDLPLPPKYTIFGKVISGLDAAGKIRAGDIMSKVNILPLH